MKPSLRRKAILLSQPFKIKVDTTGAGTSGVGNMSLKGSSDAGVSYDIRTSDGQTILANTGTTVITFPSGGVYEIELSGVFNFFEFENNDPTKLIEVMQWGADVWTKFTSVFKGCVNMDITAIDTPNVDPNEVSFQAVEMFSGCTSMEGAAANWNWDTSNIVNTQQMFQFASLFNQNIDSWNVSSVTNMQNMFGSTTVFNQPLNSWNTSSVTDMSFMFVANPVFNQPLNSWNTSSVTTMTFMFYFSGGASAFNQDISSWQISQVSSFADFMTHSTLSTSNYDNLLVAWDLQGAMSFSGVMNFGSSVYTIAISGTEHASLETKWGNPITDGGGI